jgi:hypothetical protein
MEVIKQVSECNNLRIYTSAEENAGYYESEMK